MIYFIDSNIFLRLLIREDEKVYQCCYSLIEAIKKGKLEATTSNLVLAEIAWTLSSYYKFPKDRVVLALESIVNLSNLSIVDKYQLLLGIQLYKSKSVKYIDAMIASNTELRDKSWKIISYDKDFDKLGVFREEPVLRY